jgi:hypothetical protein
MEKLLILMKLVCIVVKLVDNSRINHEREGVVYLIIYITVTSCKEKALFLLKFSGLTRITSSSDVSSHEEC